MKKVPFSLKFWFFVHFIVDFLFGIPLLFVPLWVKGLLGFDAVDPLTARLVGAALIGIGGVSFLVRKKSFWYFDALLNLKIIWSLSAILGIVISIVQGAPAITWFILVLFSVFSAIWIYYKISLSD